MIEKALWIITLILCVIFLTINLIFDISTFEIGLSYIIFGIVLGYYFKYIVGD